MGEKESERKKHTSEDKDVLTRAQSDTIQRALDGGKAMADISADERFYNRSVRIRRKVMQWLMNHVDEPFDTMGEMEALCGNFAGCSMPTARRWIFQWTREGKPFRIEEKADLYIVRER